MLAKTLKSGAPWAFQKLGSTCLAAIWTESRWKFGIKCAVASKLPATGRDRLSVKFDSPRGLGPPPVGGARWRILQVLTNAASAWPRWRRLGLPMALFIWWLGVYISTHSRTRLTGNLAVNFQVIYLVVATIYTNRENRIGTNQIENRSHENPKSRKG